MILLVRMDIGHGAKRMCAMTCVATTHALLVSNHRRIKNDYCCPCTHNEQQINRLKGDDSVGASNKIKEKSCGRYERKKGGRNDNNASK